MLEANSECCKD
jgi:hypothetical protein